MSICDTYDDKTRGIIESDECFILPFFEPCDEAIFKASYVVASSVKCFGKLTALFNLTVLGDVEATDIDVKGKFTCLGKCSVDGSIIVQNEIWANELNAVNIESHDKIAAQEINAETIIAAGNIVVCKTLAVERVAKTDKYVICGETAYGAGTVETTLIITGEPIDLDDGVNAVESPHSYHPALTTPQPLLESNMSDDTTKLIIYGQQNYAPENNYQRYIDFLSSNICDIDSKAKFTRWKEVLYKADSTILAGEVRYNDITIMIWLTEIIKSEYFEKWDAIIELYRTYENHFKKLLSDNKDAIVCNINNFYEWLEILSILYRYGASIDKRILNDIIDRVISHIGVRSRFVLSRLSERGWVVYAK